MREVSDKPAAAGEEAQAAGVLAEWKTALTMPEAARQLAVPLSTLHRRVAAGDVRTIRLFGRIKVPHREIIRVLLAAGQRQGA
jgi:hypothetical protein